MNTNTTTTEKAVSTIAVGEDTYYIYSTSGGEGIRIENRDNSLFIPYGEEGTKVATQLVETLSR